MLKRFLPQQSNFFALFKKMANTQVLASTEFHHMLIDLPNQQRYVNVISQYENDADKIAHQIFELLHKTFITPFDRHDIHRLTSKMDDILDKINRCAQRFPYYELEAVPQQVIELAELSMHCCKLLNNAVGNLDNLKLATEIFKFCEDIDYLESQAHTIHLAGEKHLFTSEIDFKHFFKLNEVYTRSRSVINSCQDAANIIKGITLEYS